MSKTTPRSCFELLVMVVDMVRWRMRCIVGRGDGECGKWCGGMVMGRGSTGTVVVYGGTAWDE